jgi:RNA polymerase sigma-70 factor (ECF subfamily)
VVLMLRDVLGFPAAEVAEMVDSSEAAVKAALQRARAALEAHLPAGGWEQAPLPRSQHERELVGRFADAVESGNVERLVSLLTDDARVTMPPTRSNTRAGRRSPDSSPTANGCAARLRADGAHARR